MSQLDEITAVKVFGEECSLKEVLQLLNMRDGLRPAAEGIVARRIFRKKAEELGLTVSDEELQKEADDQRTAMQLHKAEDAKAWLAARNMTLEDYETLLEDGLLTKKVKDVISEGRIESYFSEKRH